MATIRHVKTNNITDWSEEELAQQIAAGNFPVGTTLSDIVLPSDWNDDHQITDFQIDDVTGLQTALDAKANSADLADVATSGDYNDLSNKPTIPSPSGSAGAIQFSNGSSFDDDSNLTWDDTNKRLSVQAGSTPQSSIHGAAAVGTTINNVVTGSASLLNETLPSAPTGSITQIVEPAAGSGGSASYTNGGSGGFIGSANGTVYEFRVYPCLYVAATGAYYRSQFYETISAGSDPNDGNSYDIAVNWGSVTISGETVYYYVEFTPDAYSNVYPLGVYTSTGETFTSQSGSNPTAAWPSYYNNTPATPAGAASSIGMSVTNEGSGSFSPASDGTTWYYELDSYVNIGGTAYVSGSPIATSMTDNNNGMSYDWYITWSDGSPSDGLIIRRSNDNSNWSYQFISTGGSYTDYGFSDDPSAAARWGQTYSGGAITYYFTPYNTGTAPSGNAIYSTAGSQYNTAIAADSFNYILKHSISGSTNGKILENQVNTYGQTFTGSTYYDVGYPTWVSGTTVTPSSYGFTGTNQNRDYRAYGYNPTLGIYSVIPLTISTTSSGGSKYVSGSVTYPSGVTQIKILRQVNGGGYTVSKTLASPTTAFTDDSTDATWNGNNTVTPTVVLGTAGRFDRDSTSVNDQPVLEVIATSSGTRYPKISFGVANNSSSSASYQAHIYSESSTGYLNTVGGRLQVLSSLGATASVILSSNSVFNNANSSSGHFQVKGSNDTNLISTRADQDTVGFGSTIGSDQFTTVQIQPARSGDKALTLIGHSSMSNASEILRIQDNAGSFKATWALGGNLGLCRTTAPSNATIALGATTSQTQLLFDNHSSPGTVNGGMYYQSNNYFGTDNSTNRRFVRMAGTSAGTSTSIAYFDSSGFLTSSSNLQFDGTILRPNLIRTADGSSSVPAYNFNNDPDTGVFRVTTNVLGMTAGGSEVLRLDSGGLSTNTGTNKWKFAGLTTAAAALDATKYLNVTVDGVAYKLALIT